jgi:hypothetical protein
MRIRQHTSSSSVIQHNAQCTTLIEPGGVDTNHHASDERIRDASDVAVIQGLRPHYRDCFEDHCRSVNPEPDEDRRQFAPKRGLDARIEADNYPIPFFVKVEEVYAVPAKHMHKY